MNNNTKNIFSLLFLIIVSFFAMKALIHPGFYTSHDGWHIVTRLYYFDQIIKDGQIPVRLSANLLNGFGYPLFIFSYHLPWILAEPFVLAGINIFDAIKIIFILTYIFSGIFMYLWLKQIFGKKAAIVGAFVFLFTPYRFANIYVRANIGEAVSFMTYPLIFWSIYNLYQRKSFIWISIGVLGLAGAILSHIMVIFLFSLPILFFTLYLLFKSNNKARLLMQLTLMIFLAIGITAFYLLPAIYYKPMTVFADIYKQLYTNYFTPISKLIYSPWGYGAIGTSGEMSRQVGIVIWIVNVISIPLVIYHIFRKTNLKTIFIPILCLITFFLSIFLMTKSSNSFWKIIENLAIIDFPWRFLAVTTFVSSLLSGWLIFTLRNNKFQTIIILMIIGILLYTNRNYLRVNQYTDIPLSLYIDSELTTNTDDEYLPKWVSREFAKKKQPLLNNQDIIIANLNRNSKKITMDINALNSTELQINQMWFPGWIAVVNGNNIILGKSGVGGMTLKVPQGSSHISLEFKSDTIMKTGNIISLISFIMLISGLFIYKYIWKKK